MSVQAASYNVGFRRSDGQQAFTSAVPVGTTIAEVIDRAAAHLRLPRWDLDGKKLSYSALRCDSNEIPKAKTVGEAVEDGESLTIAREYKNAVRQYEDA